MHLYSIGDKVVHPMHGAGVIDNITKETINGNVIEYYVLKLTTNNMTIMLPVAASEKIGIREIISTNRAKELLSLIHTSDIDKDANWNKRFRDNSARIKSGDLDKIVKLIKSLTYRDITFGLSAGERKMLHSAKQILLSELVLTTEKTYKELEAEISDAVSSFLK